MHFVFSKHTTRKDVINMLEIAVEANIQDRTQNLKDQFIKNLAKHHFKYSPGFTNLPDSIIAYTSDNEIFFDEEDDWDKVKTK